MSYPLEYLDSHGKVDIIEDEEDWVNLQWELKDKRQELIGSDLNTLLYGLFKLFGKHHIQRNDFSCDARAWEGVVESTFVYLIQIVPINDILSRVWMVLRRLSLDTEELALGAIDFVTFWVGQYRRYLHSQHVVTIYTFATSELSVFTALHRDNTYGLDEGLLLRLLHRLDTLLFVAKVGVQEDVDQHLHWDPSNNLSANGPQLALTEGTWDGQLKADIKEQLKKTLEEGPKIKLEIFGGEALLDSDSDDDSSRTSAAHANDANNEDDPTQISYAQVRITPGQSLLLSAKHFVSGGNGSSYKSLLDVDSLELARQWTLADHALFRCLRLHTILRNAIGFNNSSNNTSTSDEAVLSNRLYMDTVEYGGLKRLVDRFNSASTWISHVILSGETPTQRAHIITRFITLAQHLQQLGNFHGLMTVLTALQQGCVTRCVLSWEGVSKSSKDSLQQLKMLMAGGKNYARYREEMQMLQAQMPFEEMARRQEQVQRGQRAKRGLRFQATPGVAPTPDSLLSREGDLVDWRQHVSSKLPQVQVQIQATAAGTSQLHLVAQQQSSLRNHAATPDGAFHYETHAALVPHLAAHIAALSGIGEVHSGEYVPDHPHLFHLSKWRLCAHLLVPLARLQRLQYPYRPVRVLQAALTAAWRPHVHRSTAAAGRAAKRLFALSEAQESSEMIRRAQQPAPAQSQISPKSGGPKKTVTMNTQANSSSSARHPGSNHHPFSASSSPLTSPKGTTKKKDGFRKSDAYERIQRLSTSLPGGNSSAQHMMVSSQMSSSGAFGGAGDEEDSERGDEGTERRRGAGGGRPGLQRQPSRLTRMLSSVFARPVVEEDDEEDDDDEEEDDEDDEEEEGDDGSEDDEDDDEEDDEKPKKRKLRPLKHLLRAISFKK